MKFISWQRGLVMAVSALVATGIIILGASSYMLSAHEGQADIKFENIQDDLRELKGDIKELLRRTP